MPLPLPKKTQRGIALSQRQLPVLQVFSLQSLML
jgi:hypothetical protein